MVQITNPRIAGRGTRPAVPPLLHAIAWGLLLACSWGPSALGAETEWLTGDPLLKRLAEPTSLTWQQTPVREGLARLAEAHQVAIFLDRTLDPDRRLDLSVENKPLRDILRHLAQQLEGDLGYVGPVVYLGPPFICQRIATLAELQNQRMAQKLPDRHRELLRPTKLQWNALAEPRQLIRDRLSAAQLATDRADAIPHDVWPAYDLPPMTWAEQMTLLLAGFRLSFVVTPDGQEIRWTQFPKAVAIRREYPGGAGVEEVAAELQQELPQAFVNVEQGRLVVRSTLEDHWAIQQRFKAPTAPRIKPAADRSNSRFTLTVKNQPVRAILAEVARKMDRQLAYDDNLPLNDETRTSFTVTDATEHELLTAIVTQAGLAFELDDTTIRIRTPD